MKRIGIVAGVLVLFIAVGRIRSDANPPVVPIAEAPGTLMRAKLTTSQRMLAGLLKKDFEAVAQGARDMKHISEAAEWPRARDHVYEHFSAEFRRQCTQLEDLAKKGNHEGVSFVYLHMTTTCINCHDYVRDSMRIAMPDRPGDVRRIPSEWPDRSLPSETR